MGGGEAGDARSIGEIVRPILRRIEAMYHLQQLLDIVGEPAGQRSIIQAARGAGTLDDVDAERLCRLYELEAL